MEDLKENNGENVGEDGHVNGGGFSSSDLKSKRNYMPLIAISALVVIVLLLLIVL